MHRNFVLLLLSFCIKTAEFDSIKCTNCVNQQQQNGNNSIFEGLRQFYGKDEQMQLTNIICEADKMYCILEAIKTEVKINSFISHIKLNFRLKKTICCNLEKNDKYNFIKKRIALINHNDPPLSHVMDTLIVTLMSLKKAMESGKIDWAIVKTLKNRLKYALNFIAKRNQIQFDEKSEFTNLSNDTNREYFLKEMTDFFEWSKIVLSDKKCGQKCENEQDNANNNFKDKSRTKRFLQFVAKAIEICDNGTAKRRKSLLAAFDQFPSIAVDNELDCAICLDQIRAGIHVKQLPSCEHIFHADCIKAWIQGGHSACPMCRQQILAETEAQNEHQMHGIASGAEMGNSSNDPSVIVQIDEEHQSETSADEDEADQNAENTQMANMV